MKYLDRVFYHGVGGTPEYRDNWDRIFGKKSEPDAPVCKACKQNWELCECDDCTCEYQRDMLTCPVHRPDPV